MLVIICYNVSGYELRIHVHLTLYVLETERLEVTTSEMWQKVMF